MHSTVSKEAACPLGSRAGATMQLLLACWELEGEKLDSEIRVSHKGNGSQNSRTPHLLTLITKSWSWQPAAAGWGLRAGTGARVPLQKAAFSLRHKVFQFFSICIIKWVFKGKKEYVNHNRVGRKESINLVVYSQIFKKLLQILCL